MAALRGEARAARLGLLRDASALAEAVSSARRAAWRQEGARFRKSDAQRGLLRDANSLADFQVTSVPTSRCTQVDWWGAFLGKTFLAQGGAHISVEAWLALRSCEQVKYVWSWERACMHVYRKDAAVDVDALLETHQADVF